MQQSSNNAEKPNRKVQSSNFTRFRSSKAHMPPNHTAHLCVWVQPACVVEHLHQFLHGCTRAVALPVASYEVLPGRGGRWAGREHAAHDVSCEGIGAGEVGG